MASEEEEDFVYFGTPIEREEDITTTRKKKAVAEASGNLRTLVPWKQEVRDEEGRRRFHGAFSGGFSAGYYNTVGSKEGWTPQTFTSSRKNRAEVKKQSILIFLDDDEKAELEGNSLGTSMQFDTFGSTAAELARKQAEKEREQRPSAIPGPVPDEIVLPASDSIGVNLLLKMGWRQGRSLKDSHSSSLSDARREARKAFLALSSEVAIAPVLGSEPVEGDLGDMTELPTDAENQLPKSTPVYVLNPKQDLHGLGYDPFRNAPEFRERKRSRVSGHQEMGIGKHLLKKDSLYGFKSGRIAPGFGIGALEELDLEDEDVYASGYDFVNTYVQEIEEPARLAIEDKKEKGDTEHGVLRGFKVASFPDYQLERFNPPMIPKDFVPHHKFSAPLEINKLADVAPPDVTPPEDKDLRTLIEGVATLVARCGKLFEDLSREKNQSNPLFSFLRGGDGHSYYIRKLWEEHQKRGDHTKQLLDVKLYPSEQKMTAESRGKILGEKPLKRSSKDLTSSVTSSATVNLQVNLTDTFTNPASFIEPQEVAKPFRDDPSKQKRFEQYLKEKYQGGLRSKDSGGASYMSEADRARERLEFESAALAIEKGKWGKEANSTNQQLFDLSASTGLQFTSGGLEQAGVSQAEESIKKELYPKREEFQWRPASILCKRFELTDPYLGKPPPAPRMRSKMDSLIFMPDLVKTANTEETAMLNKVPSSVPQSDREIEVEVEVENVERPVDLYKAIFSDDSDDEDENASRNQVDYQQRNTEIANTTISRLVAGDFLESLGKELGLEVPPEHLHSEYKSKVPDTWKENVDANKGEYPNGAKLVERKLSSTTGAIGDGSKKLQEVPQVAPYHQERGPDENNLQKAYEEHMKVNSSKRRQDQTSSAPEDEQGKQRSRHRRKTSNSDVYTADSSDDSRDRHQSRSKGRTKGSKRERSSSRKHSKHHKHRSAHSSSSPRHGSSRKDHGDSRREKRRYRD